MQLQQPRSVAAYELRVGDYIVGPTLNDTVRITRVYQDSDDVCVLTFRSIVPDGPVLRDFPVARSLRLPLVISAAEIAERQRIALGLQKD